MKKEPVKLATQNTNSKLPPRGQPVKATPIEQKNLNRDLDEALPSNSEFQEAT
jgi:hypothetical protein